MDRSSLEEVSGELYFGLLGVGQESGLSAENAATFWGASGRDKASITRNHLFKSELHRLSSHQPPYYYTEVVLIGTGIALSAYQRQDS